MSEWREMRIGDYADTFAGGTPDRGNDSLFGGTIPWIKSTEVNLGRIKATEEFLSEKGLRTSAAKWIPASSVLVAMYGATAAQVAYLEIEATANQAVLAICPREELDPLYLFYALTSAKHRLLYLAQGSGQPNLNKQIVDRFEVPAPHPPQQRRIATILTSLDEVIEATEKLVEKHQQIKAGLMHDLFTRGLWTRPELARGDHKGLPSEASAKEGHLRPAPEEAPGLYLDSPLGLVPKEWEVDRAGNLLARIEQGWSPDCESVPPEGDEWGVLKTSAVVWDGFEPRESKRLPGHLWPRTEYKVTKGDVLMTRAGPNSRVGVVALVDTSEGNLMLSDKIYRCVPNDRVEPEFLVLALTSEGTQHVLEGYKTGLAESQTNISQAIVRKLWIPLPKSDERTLICELAATVTNQLRATTTHLAKLRQQKQGLMHDLLTGRVRVDGLALPEK